MDYWWRYCEKKAKEMVEAIMREDRSRGKWNVLSYWDIYIDIMQSCWLKRRLLRDRSWMNSLRRTFRFYRVRREAVRLLRVHRLLGLLATLPAPREALRELVRELPPSSVDMLETLIDDVKFIMFLRNLRKVAAIQDYEPLDLSIIDTTPIFQLYVMLESSLPYRAPPLQLDEPPDLTVAALPDGFGEPWAPHELTTH